MMQPRWYHDRNGIRFNARLARIGKRTALFVTILFLTLVCWSSAQGQAKNTTVRNTAAAKPLAPQSTPLSRGIAFYEAGKNTEALNELRTVVAGSSNRGRALAYYYAALIRMEMGNLPATRKNLLSARDDSASFYDAIGLLAYVNLKLGNRTDALIEWREFVKGVGSPDSGRVAVDSITLPEEHYRKLARAEAIRSIPVSSHKDTVSSLAKPDTAALANADTAKNKTRPAIGKPDSAGVTLTNIDQRIESQIRRGYYSIGVTAALLLVGLAGIAWWMRRRRRTAPQGTFSASVDRALDEVDADEGLLPDEESLEREFEQRRREIREENPREKVQSTIADSPRPTVRSPQREDRPETEFLRRRSGDREPGEHVPLSSAAREEQSIFPSFESDDQNARLRSSAPARSGPGAESGRHPVTEEVKALVTRMHREGHSVVEIARMADLTRTEVELIVAVRARNVEQLIETASSEEDDVPDQGALYRAIGELHAEGGTPQEIARRLSISATEVNLALAMMDRKRKGKR